MATRKDSSAHLDSLMQSFEERAKLAEERLAKLEAVVQNNQGSGGQGDLLNSLIQLREKLEKAKVEQDAERQKLIAENKKLQYQVLHLKRAVNEADAKLVKSS